jgi:hypothetical protein
VVPTFYDGGASIAADSPATSTDLGPATVAAGKFKYDITRGLVRLGTAPSLRFTGSGTFAEYGGNSTSLPTDQLKCVLIESAGFTAGEVSITAATDFDSLGDASSDDSGIWYKGDQTTCAEVVKRVLHNYIASGGFQYDGIFRARNYHSARVPNTPTWTYTVDDIGELMLDGVLQPAKTVTVLCKPYDAAFSPAEFAGAVTSATRFDLSQRFRKTRRGKGADRYGRLWSNYGTAVRRLIVETDWVKKGQLAPFAKTLCTIFNAPTRVVSFNLLTGSTSEKPKIGDTALLTFPAYNFDSGVECLVTGVSESQPGNRIKVQLMDATTLTS